MNFDDVAIAIEIHVPDLFRNISLTEDFTAVVRQRAFGVEPAGALSYFGRTFLMYPSAWANSSCRYSNLARPPGPNSFWKRSFTVGDGSNTQIRFSSTSPTLPSAYRYRKNESVSGSEYPQMKM